MLDKIPIDGKSKFNRVSFLTLFFCLSWTLAFAAKPTIVSLSPSSGTVTPNTTKNFTCTYSDLDGWANLKEAYFLISPSSVTLTNAVYLYYDQNTNLLYLRNDANTSWLGGFTPGAASTIQNSQVTVNCAATTVTGSLNNLTVSWNLTFKTAFSGKAYNTYLYIKDDTASYAGWTRKGTYTINSAPLNSTITPSSGTGLPDVRQVFSAAYTDNDGWQNIQYAYLLINTSASGANCFYGHYSQNTNLLYLRNDANNTWLGGFAPGSANIIENSYTKLDCAATSISGSGTTLTVNWAVSLKPYFTGTKKTYLYVKDDLNAYQGLTQKGTWTIPNHTPSIGTISPASGTSMPEQAVSFITTFTDTDTWPNIQYVYLLINTSASGLNCFYGYYNQNSNKLYLRNDANGAWLGGFTPGSANVIENTYAKLDCAQTTVSGSGNTLTINWKVTFKSTFTGAKKAYLYVRDDSSAYQNYTQKGTWTIQPDTMPPVITLNPVISPTNQNVVLSYTVSDDQTPVNEIVVTGDNSPYTTEGLHNVILTAKDRTGNTATANVNFIIDKTKPVILITFPLDGAVVEDSPVQLAGTVDGVAFSESFSLNPGNNTLTKTATDAAGNSNSVSINVYLYLGQLIGPQGGEVYSPDGKVKITIPPGALSTSQRIRILTVDKAALEGLTPAQKTLLYAVECKPIGLNFLIPVFITYTLDQALVPGTAVSLGLYEGGRIYLTSEPTVVPVDGYTVTFRIQHFSTYTALASMIPQGTPIGTGVKIPLPDLLTGSFSHAIPIAVAPGRKGMQPQVALTYRSSNPNSWVGTGFGLNPGYITRSTRLGPASYTDNDTFYFISDAGTTELIHLIDNLYQAKVESSFTKFFKESDDTWKIVSKDGSILRFGQSTDSKETSSSGTFSWYITRATDTNGNYIEYHYTKDQGKSYLSSIDYTGNEIGVNPTHTVEFFLEARDDVSSSYLSTAKIATARRLKEIQNKINGILVWRYELEYIYSPDTNRSLLKSVTQYGSDNKNLPKQILTYQQAR